MVQDKNGLKDFDLQPNDAIVRLGSEGARSLWGVAPIAPIHVGYDSLLIGQKKLVSMGLSHTILLADYHAMLSHNYSWHEISIRATYYEMYLRCAGLGSVQFVRGSNFQLTPDYTELLYAAMRTVKVSVVKKSLSRASKQRHSKEGMKVSEYIYGLMQVLDVDFLGADVVFAERSQERLYKLKELLSHELLQVNSLMGRAPLRAGRSRKPVFVYIPTSHDIKGKPLRESSTETRISIHESKESLRQKIKEVYAPPAGQEVPQGRVNALLELYKYSVFPWCALPIIVCDTSGKMRSYETFVDFNDDYSAGILHPNDCKEALFTAMWERLSKIQAEMGSALCHWVDVGRIHSGGKR